MKRVSCEGLYYLFDEVLELKEQVKAQQKVIEEQADEIEMLK